MWWYLTLLGLLASGISFVGVMVGMYKGNRLWIKRFTISFVISFVLAFIAVGIAGGGA